MDEAVIAVLRHPSLRIAVPLLLLAVAAYPATAFAHRLDEYLQATLVDIEPAGIRLQINLTPGESVADQILAQIDRDGDGVISPAEATAYAESFKRDLTIRLDGRPADLKLAASTFPAAADLRGGWGIIQLEFAVAAAPLNSGPHTLTLENRHMPGTGAYLLNAAQPRSGTVRIAGQKRNENQSVGEIEFSFHPPRDSPRAVGIAALSAVMVIIVIAAAWRPRKNLPPLA